jgi:hypothetical protein
VSLLPPLQSALLLLISIHGLAFLDIEKAPNIALSPIGPHEASLFVFLMMMMMFS